VEERELVVVRLRVLFLFRRHPHQVRFGALFVSLGGWGYLYTLFKTDVRQLSPAFSVPFLRTHAHTHTLRCTFLFVPGCNFTVSSTRLRCEGGFCKSAEVLLYFL
jgi:hypothetical protein